MKVYILFGMRGDYLDKVLFVSTIEEAAKEAEKFYMERWDYTWIEEHEVFDEWCD